MSKRPLSNPRRHLTPTARKSDNAKWSTSAHRGNLQGFIQTPAASADMRGLGVVARNIRDASNPPLAGSLLNWPCKFEKRVLYGQNL